MSHYKLDSIKSEAVDKILIYLEKYIGICFWHQNWNREFRKNLDLACLTCNPKYVNYSEDNSKINTILHIQHDSGQQQKDTPYISHILLLLFEMFICNVEYGYLCICLNSDRFSTNSELINDLELQNNMYMDIQETLETNFYSPSNLTFRYRISEIWKNSIKSNIHITVFKIHPHHEDWQNILSYIINWIKEHNFESPTMNRKEKRKIKKWLKLNDFK